MDIISFAQIKLIRAESLAQTKGADRHAAELAALGVRLLLEFGKERKAASTNMEERLVEGNMRIAYTVPQHRYYMQSGYSSEPILAEAAANVMQQLRRETTINPNDMIAKTLIQHVDSGVIGKGDVGELVGRLLLILAFDLAQEASQSNTPRWSKPVGVIKFMESLVGENNYAKHIKRCTPDNRAKPGVAFEDYFKNSVVRFTHFVRAADATVMVGDARSAFLRGFAIQCHPFQESFDVAVPVLIDPTKPITEDNMTWILISLKNKKKGLRIEKTTIDADKLGCFPQPDSMDDPETRRSYISLIMELGIQHPTPSPIREPSECCAPTSNPLKRHGSTGTNIAKKAKTDSSCVQTPRAPSSTIDTNWQGVRSSPRASKTWARHPRYLIRIRGCSSNVYAVVHEKDAYTRLLRAEHILSEHSRKGDYLKAAQRLMPDYLRGSDGEGIWVVREHYTETTNIDSTTEESIEVGKWGDQDTDIED